jgi:hypothetical protein
MRKILSVICSATLLQAMAFAQGPARGGEPPPTPRTSAPIDLTGYWVAVITEDWRWIMVTPAKGDYASVPLTVEGKRVADTWDPAADEAKGEQCRAYGAPGLMRGPTRLHITWQDDSTLKVETDYGTQTRLMHFGARPPAGGPPTLQGFSVAEWVMPAGRGGQAQGAGAPPAPPGAGQAGAGGRSEGPPPRRFGSIKSVTTRLRPGYLRKNGVPYSANAVFTEYWDVHQEKNGDQILVLTNVVDDSIYLQTPWITSLHFKKEPSGQKWDPTPCSARF